MKSWNLSNFDQVMPNVLTEVDKEASAEVAPIRRRRKFIPPAPMVSVGMVVLVASISLTSIQMNVSGSDNELRISSSASFSNVSNDRPPLALLFGGTCGDLKWSATHEQEMLERAAASVAASTDANNRPNMIHSVLREKLPKDRKSADEL